MACKISLRSAHGSKFLFHVVLRHAGSNWARRGMSLLNALITLC